MKNTIHINCQIFENYNVGPEGFGDTPHWKPKGGHTFSIEMDADILMYADNVTDTFTKMVESHNSIAEKFEYIGYEVIWTTPTVLGTDADFLRLNSLMAETNA